jgi:hypothetical protein
MSLLVYFYMYANFEYMHTNSQKNWRVTFMPFERLASLVAAVVVRRLN